MQIVSPDKCKLIHKLQKKLDWKLAKTLEDLPKKYKEGKPFLAMGTCGFPLIMSVVNEEQELSFEKLYYIRCTKSAFPLYWKELGTETLPKNFIKTLKSIADSAQNLKSGRVSK